MAESTQIVWRGTPSSEALEARIREELSALDSSFEQITAARVVVEAPRKNRHGGHFVVKIELSVPGRVITASRDPVEGSNAEDPYAAVNEAFANVRRQLVEYVQVRRGEVKRHAAGLASR